MKKKNIFEQIRFQKFMDNQKIHQITMEGIIFFSDYFTLFFF